MRIQRSFVEQTLTNPVGTLYLVATPIGNLEDITLRALNTLKSVDFIAAEDTRHTRKLLSFYEIQGKLISYHEHNKHQSGQQLLDILQQGHAIALVSDAGMPAISDPGYELVQLAIAHEIPVVPIPGANAALAALVAAGLSPIPFTFLGFLPRDKKHLRQMLTKWGSHEQTMIIYESPHRLKQTLTMVLDAWGNRQVVLARELTKKYEEFMRGELVDCLQQVSEHGAKGEYCIVIGGAEPATTVITDETVSPLTRVAIYIEQGISEKEAIRSVAQELGLPRRDIYNQFMAQKKSSDES
jgi:16S rRNA (cytidine1402-2'-O)-methyltransferase